MGATTKTATPDQLKELHPWMIVDDIYRACYTDDGSEGWIDPYSLHTWFKDEAIKLGTKINWIDGRLLTPKVHPYREKYRCDATVITAGCWTGLVAKQWDIEIPVKGHKHTVYNILTEAEHIPTMPLVADFGDQRERVTLQVMREIVNGTVKILNLIGISGKKLGKNFIIVVQFFLKQLKQIVHGQDIMIQIL